MRNSDDQEDDIVSAGILCRECDSYRKYLWLVRELNLLLQQLNLLLLLIAVSNFNLVLK